MNRPLLRVEVEHGAGTLRLRASFDLHAPRAALWGPSGAGKSTLLRILAGLKVPARGRVELGKRVLLDTERGVQAPPGARGVGFVTQTPALFPHLTAEGNLRFGLRGLPVVEQQRCVSEISALFGLEELLRRLPGRLSGGERQRVALARALAPGPRLLLLDEPFSALDGARKAEIWGTLEPWLRERGVAMLLVSHDPAEVWAHTDVVLRMEEGVVREQGPSPAVLARERETLLRQLGAK